MLIRMSDRVRFCDREVVAAGALQAIPSIYACFKRTSDRRRRLVPDNLEGTSFSRRDPSAVAFCPLSIKPNSYAQGKTHQQIGIRTSSNQIGMYPVAARFQFL